MASTNMQVAPPVALSITQRYSDGDSFIQLLNRIGVPVPAIQKLQEDDFVTMQSLVTNYSTDVDSFISYLKGINKTYGSNTRTRNIRFSPIVIKRLSAVLFHFTQSVGCIHCIPNMENIDAGAFPDLIQTYETHKKRVEQSDEDDGMIELPELKGHSNWTTYRDKFLSNLAIITGVRHIPLTYVVDEADRPRITRTTAYFEVELINLADDEFYARNNTHHGPQYTEDNAKVWMLLKKSLLGCQPCTIAAKPRGLGSSSSLKSRRSATSDSAMSGITTDSASMRPPSVQT